MRQGTLKYTDFQSSYAELRILVPLAGESEGAEPPQRLPYKYLYLINPSKLS